VRAAQPARPRRRYAAAAVLIRPIPSITGIVSR
jgi:hypothetical protein